MGATGGSRTVTVLFTDLVGSTTMLTRLGARTFDQVRRAHFTALRKAIDRAGGKEVKNTGDGLMVMFDSVVDAILGAVAMQQATERQQRSGPAPLAIRVGISVGEATFEDGDLFGAPVVEAARLVAAAGPGRILTTAIVKALVRGRVQTDFVDRGLLELKGLPEPVPVCEVAWEPPPDPLVPMPGLLTDVGEIFVGRGKELERLRELWNDAGAGERRIVLLAGEPGVGKTRLAAELAVEVHEDGLAVLAGRCDEDLGVPYQPFVEALRQFVDYAPDLAGRLGRYAGELVRLVPELAERVTGLPPPLRSDPETEQYRLFDAVAAWLSATSPDQPVLLVIDDLQWAAKPTLLLLRHILRSLDPVRFLVIATYRDTELGLDHPLLELLADLRRQAGVERMPLAGLDQSEAMAFMEKAAGRSFADQDLLLARAVYEETEGNPFFLREVFRHLTETGTVAIPAGVREVVERRLARLSEEANGVLRVAAVAGAEFELSVLRSAQDLEEEGLISALEEAAAARLVLEAGGRTVRYRFAHILVRDTLYAGISAARRVALHRQVAEAIEAVHGTALDAQLPALAHHWARASAREVDTARAVHYATLAGDAALAQLANDEAAGYYRQALELLAASGVPAQNGRRVGLLIALGEAQRRAGDPAHRTTLLGAAGLAQEQGDNEALVRAALANQRGVWASGGVGKVDAERIAVLRGALDTVPPGDSVMRARLLAVLSTELIWAEDRAHRRALSDEAVAIARRLGEPATLAEVLLHRQVTIVGPDTLTERLTTADEILSLAEQLGDPAVLCRTLFLRVRAAWETGAMEDGDRFLDAADQLLAELGQPTLRWMATVYRASRLIFAGRLDEAEVLVSAVEQLGESTSQPDAPLYALTQRVMMGLDRGGIAEFAQPIAGVMGQFGGSIRPAFEAMLGLCLWEAGRHDEAGGLLDGLAEQGFDWPVDNGWLLGLSYSAALCALVENARAAERLHQLLAPYADQVVAVAGAITGSVSHYLGLLATTLGRLDEAEGRFSAAVAVHQRAGAPAWLARSRLEWARMLLTRRHPGDVERAREHLHQAVATSRELRLDNVEPRALALLGT